MAEAPLAEGRLPESWLPPEHVRQWRSRTRLRNTLANERTSWIQRIRATLYHHGVTGAPDNLRTRAGREFLARLKLPVDALERITVALKLIDLLEVQIAEIERDLRKIARRQTGCKALIARVYGIGELSSLVTLCELGDVSRLHASRQAVRLAGLDIGVHRSDRHARLGKLTRQGSPEPRWVLYESAQYASRPTTPTTPTTSRSEPADSPTPARRSRSRANSPAAATTSYANSGPPPSTRSPTNSTTDNVPFAPTSPPSHDASQASGQLPERSRHPPSDGPPQTERPESLHRNDRSTISSPTAGTGGRGPR